MESNYKIRFPEWREVRKQLLSKEEILESNLRIALIEKAVNYKNSN